MCPPIRTAFHSHLVSFPSNPPVEPYIALHQERGKPRPNGELRLGPGGMWSAGRRRQIKTLPIWREHTIRACQQWQKPPVARKKQACFTKIMPENRANHRTGKSGTFYYEKGRFSRKLRCWGHAPGAAGEWKTTSATPRGDNREVTRRGPWGAWATNTDREVRRGPAKVPPKMLAGAITPPRTTHGTRR